MNRPCAASSTTRLEARAMSRCLGTHGHRNINKAFQKAREHSKAVEQLQNTYWLERLVCNYISYDITMPVSQCSEQREKSTSNLRPVFCRSVVGFVQNICRPGASCGSHRSIQVQHVSEMQRRWYCGYPSIDKHLPSADQSELVDVPGVIWSCRRRS